MKTEEKVCPCGSDQSLQKCCLPMIQGKQAVPTAEALIRSRYTAFVLGSIDYIINTHHSRTRGEVSRESIEQWSKESQWQGIVIHDKTDGTEQDEKGTVTFNVKYQADGKLNDHWEVSLFEKEKGEWKFVDAQSVKPGPVIRTAPKLGRNDPCACGSGKKVKKCCGA